MAPRISLEQARRLTLHAQGLAEPPEPGTAASDVVARIGCLQLDPVAAVARSPLLVLRARLRGGTHRSHAEALDRAAYGPRTERTLFDYWAHEASLCHVDDLPLHRWAMRTYIERLSPARRRVGDWLEANAAFAEHVIDALEAGGPLRAGDLEDRSEIAWEWGHWTDEVSGRQNIARMLERLWMCGRAGIGSRRGIERLWDVFERCVPEPALAAAEAAPLDGDEVCERAVLRAVSMLGVARAPHINAHFTRRRYPGLGGPGAGALGRLEERGELVRVDVADRRGPWWALPERLDAASSLEPGARTVALSPFDNLICDRARAEELFGFDHRLEIYVPAAKRRWGYYVLPILHGERFIARVDLRLDRSTGDAPRLEVLTLHGESGRRAPRATERAIRSLAHWLGAESPY